MSEGILSNARPYQMARLAFFIARPRLNVFGLQNRQTPKWPCKNLEIARRSESLKKRDCENRKIGLKFRETPYFFRDHSRPLSFLPSFLSRTLKPICYGYHSNAEETEERQHREKYWDVIKRDRIPLNCEKQ